MKTAQTLRVSMFETQEKLNQIVYLQADLCDLYFETTDEIGFKQGLCDFSSIPDFYKYHNVKELELKLYPEGVIGSQNRPSVWYRFLKQLGKLLQLNQLTLENAAGNHLRKYTILQEWTQLFSTINKLCLKNITSEPFNI